LGVSYNTIHMPDGGQP